MILSSGPDAKRINNECLVFIHFFILFVINFFDIGALSVSPIHYTRLISVDRLVALVNTDG